MGLKFGNHQRFIALRPKMQLHTEIDYSVRVYLIYTLVRIVNIWYKRHKKERNDSLSWEQNENNLKHFC